MHVAYVALWGKYPKATLLLLQLGGCGEAAQGEVVRV